MQRLVGPSACGWAERPQLDASIGGRHNAHQLAGMRIELQAHKRMIRRVFLNQLSNTSKAILDNLKTESMEAYGGCLVVEVDLQNTNGIL